MVIIHAAYVTVRRDTQAISQVGVGEEWRENLAYVVPPHQDTPYRCPLIKSLYKKLTKPSTVLLIDKDQGLCSNNTLSLRLPRKLVKTLKETHSKTMPRNFIIRPSRPAPIGAPSSAKHSVSVQTLPVRILDCHQDHELHVCHVCGAPDEKHALCATSSCSLSTIVDNCRQLSNNNPTSPAAQTPTEKEIERRFDCF